MCVHAFPRLDLVDKPRLGEGKYYLTKLGRRVLFTALVLRELFVQPSLVRCAF
ncbi:MAG: hypothetical protein N838_25690 [Thiohalocapsa sp. PB-PSB1]|jgi:hypothetical protein|nr:MAG: hypothetical protein N838_25690 [Thiohalocapsa sp. PB-PSB1]